MKETGDTSHLKSIASHENVYTIGTISHHGLAAIIAISPYIRRLQAIRYYSDLRDVLQTTYEQHVKGTSEYMYYYPIYLLELNKTRTELLINLLEKKNIIDNKTKNKLKLVLRQMYREYEKRLQEVAPISSLIGMLAAPPYRRPYGTAMKRLYIRKLSQTMWSIFKKKHIYETKLSKEEKTIDSSLRDLLESFTKFYQSIFEAPIIHSTPNQNNIIENYLKNKIKEINEIFRRLIFKPSTPSSSNIEDIINYISRSAAFLLRYRTLGSILGAADAIKYLLRYLADNAEKAGNQLLVNVLDNILKLQEAMLINFQSTIINLKDLQDKNGTLYISPIGMDDVILFPLIDLVDNNEYKEYIKTKIHKLLEEIVRGYNANDQKKKEKIDKCIDNQFRKGFCIIKIKRNCNCKFDNITNRDVVELGYESSDFEIIFLNLKKIKNEFHYNDNTYCCLEKIKEKDGEYGIGLIIDNMTNELYEIIFKGHKIKPLYSYFDLNLIQSDMIPSAFQLDLMLRLKKDLGMGFGISPDRLSEVVGDIELYSQLTSQILNLIYTHTFLNQAISSYRTHLIYSAKQKWGECGNTITRGEGMALLYYLVLSKEFNKLKNELIELKYIILQLKSIRNEILSNVVDSLVEILGSYTRLLDTLSILLLKEKNKINIRECFNKIKNNFVEHFASLIDDQIEKIFALHETENPQDRSTKVQIPGYIPFPTLLEILDLIDDNTLRNLVSGKYNLKAYIISSIIQTIDLTRISKMLLNKINNSINQNLVSLIDLALIVPTSGIIKTYFHFPESIEGGLKTLKTINPERININTKTRTIEGISKALVNYLKNYNLTIRNIENNEIILPINMSGHLVAPNLRLWKQMSPPSSREDLSKKLTITNDDITGEPSLAYNLNLIYIPTIKAANSNFDLRGIHAYFVKALKDTISQIL